MMNEISNSRICATNSCPNKKNACTFKFFKDLKVT